MRAYRVLPYCWNDETPLSSHELRMDDDVYQSRQDPAITVGFKVVGDGGPLAAPTCWCGRRRRGRCRPTRRSPSTPTSTYVEVAGADGRRYVLAAGPAGRLRARVRARSPRCVGTYAGADLLGMRYLPPFPYFMDSPNAFQVLPRRLRHHRGRHRHRAHVAGIRRGRHGHHRRRGHRRRSRRSTPRAASTRPFPTTRASMCSTPTRRSSAT